MGGRLINWALDNRFLVLMLLVLLIVFGTVALTRLPIDAVPDVTNVQVQIMTTAPALAAEETEQFITFPVENSLSGIPRVEEIRSVSQFGLSVVTVVFEEGTDIFWARQQIGERLLDAREKIPPEIPSPRMGPIATGLGEIYQFEVRSRPGFHYSLMELREELDWNIAFQLRSVPGVIEINTNGGELRSYEIQIDPDRMLDLRISMNQVTNALRDNNGNAGGGYLILHSQEQRIVRGEGLIRSLDDLGKIVVETRGDGTPIYLSQIADIRFAPIIRQGAVTRDGRSEGVVGVVMLLAGENSRAVVERVKAKVLDIEKTMPPGMMIDTFYDRTDLVRKTIDTLTKNLLEGGALVIIVLLIMLGSFRAGLIVALAVPLSMLGAFVGMVYANISGNLMSLGAIDFGLIVDGSVVLIENVVRRVAEHRHHHKVDKAPVALVREACVEMARPVVFGVGIILLVYLPILSLRGLEGKMFRPMAMTVILALVTSLLLALLLMPVLASIYLRSVSESEPFLVRWAKWIYTPMLGWVVKRPLAVLGATIFAFVSSIILSMGLGAEFIPKLDEGSIAVQASRLPSVSLETTVEMTLHMEKTLLTMPEVKSVVSKSGRPEIANDPMTINLSDLIITLKDPSTWRFDTKEKLVEEMERLLGAEVPGNIYSFSQPIELRVAELVAGVRSDVGISLYGDNLVRLRELAEEVVGALNKVPGAADVQAEQTGGLPYLRLIVDRAKVARHGINARDVLATISALGGQEVGQVFEGQRRIPIQIRIGPKWREDLEKIRRIKIADPKGRQIPLEELTEIKLEDGPAQISREAISRRTIIQCNVRGRDLAGFVGDAQKMVDKMVKLPPGYSMTWGGQFKNLQEAAGRLMIAVPLALLMIVALLYMVFDSGKLALLIFLNVPLAATGGIFALWLRGLPFSISAGVGFIALFGVAVLNGVVLVSYIVRLRQEGNTSQNAAYEGALIRLRPVLMTALVAMLGFIPMALSHGAGAEVQKPLATVVIGGLVTSSLLTLLVLPAIYPWFDSPRTENTEASR
ncbi:MAG: efflux RND transporter permease subunit [Planctomycetes bacterium]|nr:efflux RND transporter permease subunit [Planctomycetota bacterium]